MFKFSQLFSQIFYKVKDEKGLALYLAVVIMTIILAMVLGVSTILVGQIRTIQKIENSVIALYGADTGIERELKENNPIGNVTTDSMDLGGGEVVTYTVTKIGQGSGECPLSVSYCLESVGEYREIKRAIRIER